VKVKYVLKVSRQLEEKNKEGDKIDYMPMYNEIKEGKRKLDELNTSTWMDVELKIIEFNISNDCSLKMAKIRDYWLEKKKRKIVDPLNEYQDVFFLEIINI
jgi:hypothetical protein